MENIIVKSKDEFGDRMKSYEAQYNQQIPPNKHVIVRLDGKSFSKFTKGMKRPFDKDMTESMREVTKQLMSICNAKRGYTQSDEITLYLYEEHEGSEIYFNGKVQKLVSVLASYASVLFYREISKRMPERCEKIPVFDARVFEVPNEVEVENAFLWRIKDARRNSINSCARIFYSAKEVFGINTKQLLEMMEKEHNFVWERDVSATNRLGSLFRKEKQTITLTIEDVNKIPLKYRPKDRCVERNVIIEENWIPITVNQSKKK